MPPSPQPALDVALRLLALRPRTQAELRRRLAQRGFRPQDIEATIVRLSELGLVDDAAFARFWVEQRAAFRPSGRRRLIAELRAKGVAHEAIDEALQEQDDSASIEAVARRRAATLVNVREATFSRRLQAFLLRRGFDASLARTVVGRLLRERGRRDLM